MAILTPKGIAALHRITVTKQQFDLDEVEIKAAAEAALEKSKSAVRAAIEDGIEAGVPVRQIHTKGLGFAQVSQMKTFLGKTNGTTKQDFLNLVRNGDQTPLLQLGKPAKAKVAVSQFGQGANFTDASGKRAEVSRRMYWKSGMFLISQMVWDGLTEEYKTIMLEDEAFTLIGDDEIEAFENDQIVPDRWVGYVPPTN